MHPFKVLSTMSFCLWFVATEALKLCMERFVWLLKLKTCIHTHLATISMSPMGGLFPRGRSPLRPDPGSSLEQVSKDLIQKRRETQGHVLMFTTSPCRFNSHWDLFDLLCSVTFSCIKIVINKRVDISRTVDRMCKIPHWFGSCTVLFKWWRWCRMTYVVQSN